MQVRIVKNEDGVSEWMLMEMQGEITNPSMPFDLQLLGNLGWRKEKNEALLLLGHHLLEGKVAKLDKPLLILSSEERDGKKVLIAHSVARRRLVFKLRPKPIVTKQLIKKADWEKMKNNEKENTS